MCVVSREVDGVRQLGVWTSESGSAGCDEYFQIVDGQQVNPPTSVIQQWLVYVITALLINSAACYAVMSTPYVATASCPYTMTQSVRLVPSSLGSVDSAMLMTVKTTPVLDA